MTDLKQAAQQALDHLAHLKDEFYEETVDALKAALEQPEQEPTCPECKAAVLYECVACSSNNYPPKTKQEPVAWAVQGITQMIRGEFAELDAKSKAKRIGGTCVAYPLYTAPPQRPWVGLTDEEIDSCWYQSGGVTPGFARTVEAKLKEKNGH